MKPTRLHSSTGSPRNKKLPAVTGRSTARSRKLVNHVAVSYLVDMLSTMQKPRRKTPSSLSMIRMGTKQCGRGTGVTYDRHEMQTNAFATQKSASGADKPRMEYTISNIVEITEIINSATSAKKRRRNAVSNQKMRIRTLTCDFLGQTFEHHRLGLLRSVDTSSSSRVLHCGTTLH